MNPVMTAGTTSVTKRGRRSGGPRTPDGKAKSSRNSTKHGCTSQRLTLPGEDVDEVQVLVRSAELAVGLPGKIGTAIAEQVVLGLQREDRIQKVEEAIVQEAVAAAGDRSQYPEFETIRSLTKLRDVCAEFKLATESPNYPPTERRAEKAGAIVQGLIVVAEEAPGECPETRRAVDDLRRMVASQRSSAEDWATIFDAIAEAVSTQFNELEKRIADEEAGLDEKIELAKAKASIPNEKDLRRLDRYRSMSENSVLRKLKIVGMMKDLSAPSE